MSSGWVTTVAATDEQPAHKLDLPDFRIAKYPVTNAQYAAFVAATGQQRTATTGRATNRRKN